MHIAAVALAGNRARTSDGSDHPPRSGKRLSTPHHVRHSPLRCWTMRGSEMVLFPNVIRPPRLRAIKGWLATSSRRPPCRRCLSRSLGEGHSRPPRAVNFLNFRRVGCPRFSRSPPPPPPAPPRRGRASPSGSAAPPRRAPARPRAAPPRGGRRRARRWVRRGAGTQAR